MDAQTSIPGAQPPPSRARAYGVAPTERANRCTENLEQHLEYIHAIFPLIEKEQER